MTNIKPVITIAVPSFNQGQFIDDALASIFSQNIPVEVYVADGGSTDNSVEVIKKWEHKLAGWRSAPDNGQTAAINECIAKGSAPYVAWLNSDDVYLEGGLNALLAAFTSAPDSPVVYGRVWNTDKNLKKLERIKTEPFSRVRLASRCIISQPGTLMRRDAWERVDGADETLGMSMDYDLWWRLSERIGPFRYIEVDVAINRDHEETKTNTKRHQHYSESMAIVKKYYGSVPLRWWAAWPISVWWRSLKGHVSRKYFAKTGKQL
ncbi:MULTISPECIES: glycosyltransferase family 2 protein [unclassified Undibacterium]|uniref:glycosyltransferase family 2 protein n=1 Tax=unclassified Undibacterium TaxID=2630295 RepID=UPI002AC8FF9D|nr:MULTISPECIES: glycosyltransferase family 2 protein [unclassified Undibacterium]MEB0140845.1 glycosyltransferase family 2 protein [Undibacterium sp. CCC2.1]MEB0173810.1 glycosyltransferase family 2 protein [Undibacterium sp. CCC1.1]MEB0177794.1 glycosyltransferase family 2 protein [Undibacterium sp. CCC3.4]MEB0217340.1 glycosyltransferase family 2 protein [Undibacterium sp. 5I2]WPX42157.1 glycosyltransferase family 2 protein [Undibacterium sp. CCC3.4]